MELSDQAPEPAANRTTDRSMADFRAATAAQWRASVLSGEVSCVELATTALTAAATLTELGSFLHLDPDYALARASQLDSTLTILRATDTDAEARLSAQAPLLGLPTAFKDLVAVAGMPLTLGTRALPTAIPAKDAAVARRTHRAGAVSVGKTQVPEFGLPCYSENQLGPPARNPLNPALTAGGSTGGGAAAVAAGILPFALGSDGGGSVRIPAAACGLVGLKPGRGRLPDDSQSSSVLNLPVSGPIATSPEDAALLFDAMAGHRFTVETDAGETSGIRLAEGPAQRAVRRALTEGMSPLRVGVTTESPFSPEVEITLDEEAVIAVEEGISRVSQLGHLVQGTGHCTGADPFWPQHYYRDFTAVWTSRMAQSEFTAEQREQLEPLTRFFLDTAATADPEASAASVRSLQGFADSAEELFGPWDVILTPMLGFAPPENGWFASLEPPVNYTEQCRFTPFSSVVNVLGLPAINVPVHTDETGLSWSVQLIGKYGREEQLLALAAVLAREPQG